MIILIDDLKKTLLLLRTFWFKLVIWKFWQWLY